MLIAYDDVIVTAASADGASNFGEYLVADYELRTSPTAQTRVETDNSNAGYTNRTPGPRETAIAEGMRFASITGVLYYSFNNYKLIPRSAGDYVIATGVRAELAAGGPEVAIAPNPTHGRAMLVLSGGRSFDGRVEILDALGARVALVADGSIAGGSRIALPTDGLAAGTYFVRVSTATGVTVRSLVVTR
jgi:hypothetical protein